MRFKNFLHKYVTVFVLVAFGFAFCMNKYTFLTVLFMSQRCLSTNTHSGLIQPCNDPVQHCV